jgi:hypothetical protein
MISPDTAADSSGRGARMPEGYLPPHQCETASLESGPFDIDPLRWTFYCDFAIDESEILPLLLRDSAVAQGWRQCGSLLLFTKGGLVMALQSMQLQPFRSRQLDPPPTARRGYPVRLALKQWLRVGECR